MCVRIEDVYSLWINECSMFTVRCTPSQRRREMWQGATMHRANPSAERTVCSPHKKSRQHSLPCVIDEDVAIRGAHH